MESLCCKGLRLSSNNVLVLGSIKEPIEPYIQSDHSVLLPDLDPILLASFVSQLKQTQAVKQYRQALQNS